MSRPKTEPADRETLIRLMSACKDTAAAAVLLQLLNRIEKIESDGRLRLIEAASKGGK